VRILLADDHPMIRTAIDVLLRETAFEIVGTAASGDETLRKIEELDPETLLLDLQMPGGSGMEVLRKLARDEKRPKVVLLTAAIDDSSLLEAKALKVEGIVLKNSDPAFLLECLEQVERGGSWVDPEIGERIGELAQRFNARRPLAPRERDLVRCVARGLRNREIAKQLGVTEGTVKVYLHAIFDKLEVKSRTELAIRADEFLAGSYLAS
jgi:two-component system, NarL family, nitrate/nitrite response regulator NarL